MSTRPEASPAPLRGWHIAESKNEMDGTPEATLTLFNENDSSIMIRCVDRKTDVLVSPGGDPIAEANVRVKYDDSAPIRQSWHKSSSKTALFSPDPIAIARRLSKTNIFLFEYTPFESRPRIAKFNVSGLDLAKISQLCNWEALDRIAAKRQAELAALKEKVVSWVHPCGYDKEKWCWSNTDNTDGGMSLETKEDAIQDAYEHAKIHLGY
jgi:hypothetical protein